MTFPTTLALVLAAVVLLVAGLITGSSIVFLAAALFSALAVVIIWRSVRASTDNTFVSSPPAVTEPEWDRPLLDEDVSAGVDERGLPEVAIDGYEDLVAAEILPALETLSVEQLEAVIRREGNGLQRKGIIARANALIELTRGKSVDLREQEATPETPVKKSRSAVARTSVGGDAVGRSASSRKPPEPEQDLSL